MASGGTAGGAGVGGSSGTGSSGAGSSGTAAAGAGGGSPSGGASGASGAAGSATAGDGGATPLGGAAGEGGDASGGTEPQGGTGGTAGTGAAGGGMGGAGGVLDPNLGVPSHDCREDPGPDGCVSVKGVYDGMAIDQYINAADCRDGGTHAGKWVIGCGDFSDGPLMLDVPMVPPGPFSGSAGPNDPPVVVFYFVVDGATDSVTEFADNLVSSEIEGTVVVTNQPYRVVSGTFHAVWSPPESTCQSLFGGQCATAELNVTFRSRTTFGSCFSDTECTAPEICDPVGLFCTSP